ncbi:phosphoribosylamine--glycine ligase [Candidatus Woesearchaeota archaeon]|nr:phosphoribosylamine--glycine ligase [Candidatus Woesearchaeota archaeon]
MKVLVVGSGGREHALCWKISQSDKVEKIFCAPGNGGTSEVAENVTLDIMDNDELADFAEENEIDLTIVGPEAPLVNGIVDEFEERGLKIFGPGKKTAKLEGSKVFSKSILKKYNVPTGKAEIFDDPHAAIEFIKGQDWVRVIKADGLAAGKGVYVCNTEEEAIDAVKEIMVDKKFGGSGNNILVEEKLTGEEASFLVFTDGKTIIPMVSTQDHKPVYDNDKGPNTGGMGAYGPAPVVTDRLHKDIMEKVMKPVINGMREEGTPYKGVLYGGIMVTDEGPKVLEFNCRFGDPECQPIVMLFKGDLVPVLESCIDGTLDKQDVEFHDGASCCIVLASGGYPIEYNKGKKIRGIIKADSFKDVKVFHSGTKSENNEIFTDGGRVLGVTSRGESIKEAIEKAYEVVDLIDFEEMQYRKDIGAKALDR